MSLAMNEDQLKKPEESLAYLAFSWFHRVIALYCLVFGVVYWVRLLGIYEGPLWRFDLMPVHWQFASASLAVLFPVAAIGLWMMVSWGPVIWVVAAAGEIIMHYGFPELFGARPVTIATHLFVAALFIAFEVAIRLQKRKKKR